MKLESIIICNTNQNFSEYFKALFYFDCMLTGKQMKRECVNDICDSDYLILRNLIKERLSISNFRNNYPKYINNSFHKFTYNKKQIIISPGYINGYFRKIKDLILYDISEDVKDDMDFKDSSLPATKFIKPDVFKLFPNLLSMVINSTHFVGGKTMEYRTDIPALISICRNKNLTITIRARHQYHWETDKKSGLITKYKYIDVSWLSFLFNTRWESLKSECNAANYQISFKQVIETVAVVKKTKAGYYHIPQDLKVDVLEMVKK